MTTYSIVQGILLSSLWWRKWDGNPRKRGYVYMYTDSLCWTAGANITFLKQLWVCAKSLQLCPTLHNLVDCSPPLFSIHEDSSGKITGVGSYSLLQGIFPAQGSNPGLLHCKRILYQLRHQGSPRILEWVALSLLQWIFPTQKSNQGFLHCRQILYQLNCQGTPITSGSSTKSHRGWQQL